MAADAPHRSGTWLLEHYEPGARSSLLRRRLGAVAAAAADTTQVRVILAAVLPGDEEALCLLEAPSPSAIRAVCRASQFRVDRLTRVEPVATPGKEDR